MGSVSLAVAGVSRWVSGCTAYRLERRPTTQLINVQSDLLLWWLWYCTNWKVASVMAVRFGCCCWLTVIRGNGFGLGSIEANVGGEVRQNGDRLDREGQLSVPKVQSGSNLWNWALQHRRSDIVGSCMRIPNLINVNSNHLKSLSPASEAESGYLIRLMSTWLGPQFCWMIPACTFKNTPTDLVRYDPTPTIRDNGKSRHVCLDFARRVPSLACASWSSECAFARLAEQTWPLVSFFAFRCLPSWFAVKCVTEWLDLPSIRVEIVVFWWPTWPWVPIGGVSLCILARNRKAR